MKAKSLHTSDMFLYEFGIKLLGALSVFLFGLLFLAGLSS